MRQVIEFVKTTIIGGVVVVLPIVVVLLLLAKAFGVIQQQVAEPMSDTLGIRTLLGAGAVIAFAILILLAACFITGLLMRTPIGTRSLTWLEEQIFSRVPGYTLAQAVARGFAHQDHAYQVATISLFGPGTSVFGFIMEEHDSGEVTVFVPSAPAATIGLVHIVDRARVRPLDASGFQVLNCMSQWGVGAHEVLKGR
jgi:uncharacterized membrane protein